MYYSKFNNNGGIIFDEFTTFAYNRLIELIRKKRLSDGYIEIKTPALLNNKILDKTGHNIYFNDYIYNVNQFGLKPMNCPGATLFLKNNISRFNQDVVKIFEIGNVFRKENRGNWEVLKRMPNFTQDDIHIFHLNNEKLFNSCLEIVKEWKELYEVVLESEYKIVVSTMPKKCFDKNVENISRKILLDVLEVLDIPIIIEEGEGAFYGPKLDLMAKLKNGKFIQISTLQLDYFLCKNLNFKVNNIFPVVIHSALMGSIERFMYYLLNLNDEIFPFWCNKNPTMLINLLGEKDDNIHRVLAFLNSIHQKTIYFEKDINLQKILKKNKMVNFSFFYGEKEKETSTLQLKKYNQKDNCTVMISFLRGLVEKHTKINEYFGFFDKILYMEDILNE